MQKKTNTLTKEDITRYTITFWKIVIGCIAFGIILLFSVGLGLFGELPSFRDLENPKSNLASEVISDDGEVLGTYFVQNRSNVRYDQISPHVINALIATEDIRFYSHSGIDFRRTFSILFYNLIGKKQGGSTITQQLALNMFQEEGRARNPFKRFIQKLQEWIIAIKLERNYTKEEIITMYLNTVDFGSYNSFGIKAAARTYFDTTQDKLTADQAAVLVGMLKGTYIYSPIRNPENALKRRNTVLSNMHNANFLSDAETAELQAKPLILKLNPTSHNEGLAAYFRGFLKKDIQRIFKEQKIAKADGTPYDLDRDGLKIYTTINSKMQRYAEEAQRQYIRELQVQFVKQFKGRNPFKFEEADMVIEQAVKRSDRYRVLKEENLTESEIWENFRKPVKMTVFSWNKKGSKDTTISPLDSIKYYKLILRNAVMSMESSGQNAGYIRAWVGGINYEYFKYDQVKMGARQVGSTAKPFTYAAAINAGYSPCYKEPNEPITINGWTPRAHKPIPGYITLKTALAHSENWVTARVMNHVGPTAVSTLTKKMGITTNVPNYESICLGSFDATLFDMVGAYSVFVNHGIWNEPTYLLRIEDKNGTLIYEQSRKVVEALNPQTAYVMTDMLKAVVQQGTGMRLRGPKYRIMNPVGGKTGTTQNNSDGWFIGITPQLVTGVWTGAEDRAIHFLSMNQGEGANSALPVFALYMKKVYADPSLHYSKGDFEPPPGGLNITINCDAYAPKPATDSTATAAPPAEDPKP
ncbi:transglycosylase domain-containing protein [Desertivirga brevis]|uniref:transglycosylase domain-containing protein n=1 Tax=Desertivirga brevis TaxID=2810310 RepID=UPI001A96D4A0|nr:transglycosylase domain-containing protein [Pedobacter sp. SYSU D00873]